MRILIADDQRQVRFALRVALSDQPDIEIVSEVDDASALMDSLAFTQPELVVIDWLLPGLAQAGSLPGLRQILPDLRVIAISGRPELSKAALEAGADAFISKIDAPDRLLAAVDHCRCMMATR